MTERDLYILEIERRYSVPCSSTVCQPQSLCPKKCHFIHLNTFYTRRAFVKNGMQCSKLQSLTHIILNSVEVCKVGLGFGVLGFNLFRARRVPRGRATIGVGLCLTSIAAHPAFRMTKCFVCVSHFRSYYPLFLSYNRSRGRGWVPIKPV